MSIYFVQIEGGGPVKVGYANDVRRRLADLQTASFQRLRLVASMPGDRAAEAEVHKRLNHLRIRGEWFRPDPEMWEVLGDLTDLPVIAGMVMEEEAA